MDEYEVLENSVLKNIQEFTEFIVDNFGITNYYDLVDRIVYTNNMTAILKRKNNGLYKEIKKELESESDFA